MSESSNTTEEINPTGVISLPHKVKFDNVSTGLKLKDESKKVSKPKKDDTIKPIKEKLSDALIMATQFIDLMKKKDLLRIIEQDESVLKEFVYREGRDFVVLPELGTVENPLLEGTSHAQQVSVGTHAWLVVLDQLRTYGWPLEKIEKFLEKSAEVVKRDALFDVYEIDSTSNKRINKIEEFCMYWPHQEREAERLKHNSDKILDAIRKQYAPQNPFRPHNYEAVLAGREQPKGPPQKVTFVDGGYSWTNILRNFTEVVVKIHVNGNTKTQVYECTYPKGTNWVPDTFYEDESFLGGLVERKNVLTRQKFEAMYGLIPYYYLKPMQWKKYMYTLLQASGKLSNDVLEKDEKVPPEFIASDSIGRKFIFSSGKTEKLINGKLMDVRNGYRIFQNEIKLDFNYCNTSKNGDLDNELSLRQYCNLMSDRITNYPLIYLLLNVEPPEESYEFASQDFYKQFVYLAYYRGKYYRRLTMDAPLRFFRDLFLYHYAGIPEKNDLDDQCFQRFKKNVYEAIKSSGLFSIDDSKDEIKSQWAVVLEDLYNMDSNDREKCYDPSKQKWATKKLSITSSFLPSMMTKTDIETLSEKRKEELINESISKSIENLSSKTTK